jgi:hypothetical protein
MNLRHWLQHNFRLRRLRRLSEKALARFVAHFSLPSVLPRRAVIVPDAESATLDDGMAVTDVEVRQEAREVRLLSSGRVRVEGSYADALAPLRRLSPDLKAEDLARAINEMQDALIAEGSFFPLEVYLQRLPGEDGSAVEWAQYCRASRQPAIDLLLSLAGQKGSPADRAETSALLIYGRAIALDERG